MTNVVPDRLAAEVGLMRDLLGRVAELEQAQHLDLPRRQVRMWRPGWVVDFDVLDLSEDTDHMAAAAERNRADLDGEPLPIRAPMTTALFPLGRYSLRVVEVLDGDGNDTVLVVEDVSE